jgi:transcriptional regulator with XRE-family HTH domain
VKTDKELAGIIRKLRKERRMTQQELADMIGCSRWLVNRVECGVTMFSYNQLVKIAEILDDIYPLII